VVVAQEILVQLAVQDIGQLTDLLTADAAEDEDRTTPRMKIGVFLRVLPSSPRSPLFHRDPPVVVGRSHPWEGRSGRLRTGRLEAIL
jgi:hypothetical protein